MALTTYAYQDAVLDQNIVSGNTVQNYLGGNFAGGGGLSLLGHWPMNETSGSTMADISIYGANGTYRGTATGHTTVGNSGIMVDAAGSCSAYFDGDYNNGGASVPFYSALNTPTLLTMNAWVQVETMPTSAIALSASATATSGSNTISISLSNQAWTNINSALANKELVSVIIVGAASGWLSRGSGQWIPTGTIITAASSGTPGTITLSNPVGTNGQIKVNIISASQKDSFGRIVTKGGDYGLLVSHFTGQSTWPTPDETHYGPNPVMTMFSQGSSRSTNEDTFYTTTPAMITYCYGQDALFGGSFEQFYLNGVSVKQSNDTIYTQPSKSSTSGLTIFQVSTNQLTADAGTFTGFMQSLSISSASVGDWYLKMLYNLGVNGTMIYDPVNPSYRYPGTLNGTTYSAPLNVFATSWPITIVGPNANRKRITITNDSPASVWLGLGGTDFTNPYDSPLWMNRPTDPFPQFPAGIAPVGIQLLPHGGMWTSDFYQGMISAVANPWIGQQNLCVMEEVA